MNTLVNTAIATNRALEGKSQIEVNSIERIVDERTKHLLYFQNAALRNQKIADEMLEMSDKIADVEAHSRITARNKETIFGKEPQTIINNTNAQQNEVTEIRRTIVKLDK
ncbi:hypothetical protein [Campylobacter concisus]|uniref:hypothetical protein n=1 Tax=Campylobacter concisus TaxID=199 RepID=UPI0015D7B02F|nr:hypothetical protein [Campylobacter concisus]